MNIHRRGFDVLGVVGEFVVQPKPHVQVVHKHEQKRKFVHPLLFERWTRLHGLFLHPMCGS